jgi:mannan endo-1,4-beta-mannosidase
MRFSRENLGNNLTPSNSKPVSHWDAIAGTNFWTWGGYGRAGQEDFMWLPGDDFTGDPPQEHQGLNSVFDTDTSTLEVIRAHAQQMKALRGR